MKRFLLMVLTVILNCHLLTGQFLIKGTILDNVSKQPLELVQIRFSNNLSGGITDANGQFKILTTEKSGEIIFRQLGFKTLQLPFNCKTDTLEMGNIYLDHEDINLDEITISAGMVQSTETPITVYTTEARTIQKELGDRPLTFSLLSTPGIYTVRNGGGSGDAELSVRGFNQENVGVLLNGIPINGVENGLVYWSNWLGLGNAAAEIQIQKGPGFANASANSVGGSINIVTNPAASERSGSIIYQISSYGNQKLTVSLNSGQLKDGWSFSLLGSYSRGPGYVDATYINGWSYYFTLNKKYNPEHSLSITALGAPQRHGQRTLKLSDKENRSFGNRFNKDWGSLDGQINNASENFYHRPFIGINHYFSINKQTKLTNSAYLILGSGGGKWSESFNYAPTIFEYRTFTNQIDWPAIVENNAIHEGTYTLENGQTVSGYSLNVQAHFLASHVQAGFLSNFEQKMTSRLRIKAGIHYRYFNSFLREEIIDLLGGDFFIEDYTWAADGVSGRNQIKSVGDVIRVNNNTIINFTSIYTQLLYENNNWNAFLSGNFNNNWYQRVDRFNYIENQQSDVIVKPGYDFRAGLSYRPGIRHLLYLNAAIISKAPYFKYVFGNFTNVPVQNLTNEQISTIEAGYKFNNKFMSFIINGFYTNWENVSILSNEYVQLENNTQTRAMINGLKALHMGIETNVSINITRALEVGGILALGDYKWKNDVTAQLFNNQNIPIDTVNVFAKNLYVGGTAQQQVGVFFQVRIFNTINLKAEWLYFSKIFSNFEPTSRNNAEDRLQPYQIPAYNNLNIYFGIPFTLFKQSGLLQVNGYNLLNSKYIEWGEDGQDHTLDSFRGFWSFGRTFDFMLKLNF